MARATLEDGENCQWGQATVFLANINVREEENRGLIPMVLRDWEVPFIR